MRASNPESRWEDRRVFWGKSSATRDSIRRMGSKFDSEDFEGASHHFAKFDPEVGDWIFRAMEAEPEILGWGYGHKRVGGFATDELSVVVLVEEKFHKGLVHKNAVVPDGLAGMKTDVAAVGRARVLSNTEPLPRPVPWGCRISHEDGLQGTLGCVVEGADRKYLLSNCHVLARSGKAKPKDMIVQPAISLLTERDAIARLTRFIPVETTETLPLNEQNNLVDAAIAEVLPPDSANPKGYIEDNYSTSGLNLTSWRRTKDIPVNLDICKVGGMTHYKEGKVVYMNATVKVPFRGGMALFRNQILTTDIGEPGDSGSLVVCQSDGSAIGLLFAQLAATEGQKNLTIVNPIQAVQNLLRVKISPNRWIPPSNDGASPSPDGSARPL